MASPSSPFSLAALAEAAVVRHAWWPWGHPARQPVAGPSCTSRPRRSAVVPFPARGSSSLPRLTDVVGYARNSSYKSVACLLRPVQIYLYCRNRPRVARPHGAGEVNVSVRRRGPRVSPRPFTVRPSSGRPVGPRWRSPRRCSICNAATAEIASELVGSFCLTECDCQFAVRDPACRATVVVSCSCGSQTSSVPAVVHGGNAFVFSGVFPEGRSSRRRGVRKVRAPGTAPEGDLA